MPFDLNALIHRLERAQARQNDRFNLASGGESLAVGGGFAHFRGAGHPLNQALGLVEPISEDELAEVEAFLGHPVVLELSPSADIALWPLLAARGYRVHQFQQQLTRTLETLGPADSRFEIRLIRPGESELQSRVVGAGFCGLDDWQAFDPPFAMPDGVEDSLRYLALIEGEPAGGATLGWNDGVAMLGGDAVLPRFRGRGLQKALVRVRLLAAKERGCDIATASTLPSTPSQRAYEACGFRVAYPKLEMARDA
ncbi:MAG TPA: GNAT family N-acetyltransferase [Holophagaceae bacterium]|jgi:GNAT superfamily N-acetyltransferase|nr:GNAT family N-acetyltransferase [Holophagaceae bacterium]